ncbi:hypothetical protein G9A89_000268 [Geosiphon pyriformis]|nr:hypothetical protein G9A89_000268 [Geosiphon pyriformis]
MMIGYFTLPHTDPTVTTSYISKSMHQLNSCYRWGLDWTLYSTLWQSKVNTTPIAPVPRWVSRISALFLIYLQLQITSRVVGVIEELCRVPYRGWGFLSTSLPIIQSDVHILLSLRYGPLDQQLVGRWPKSDTFTTLPMDGRLLDFLDSGPLKCPHSNGWIVEGTFDPYDLVDLSSKLLSVSGSKPPIHKYSSMPPSDPGIRY